MGSKPRTTTSPRWFAVTALTSAVFSGLTAASWLIGFTLGPWSITDSFHVCGVEGRLLFYGNGRGPYRGSIIALTDAEGKRHPEYRSLKWGDSFGAYYRHFYFPESGTTLWTMAISQLYPCFLFAVLPLLWCWRRWHTTPTLNSCHWMST